MTSTEHEIVERLFAAAITADNGLRTRAELESHIVEFGTYPVRRTHDWRNHIHDAVLDEWDELPLVAKLAAFIPAAYAAHCEEWD